MCTGAIAWCDFTWEAFATLITGLSAVIGAIFIGFRQVEIQRHQTEIQLRQTRLQEAELRADLFDRRYRVFERAEKFLAEILRRGDDPSPETQAEFSVATGEARFLFGPDVTDGLDEIWTQWSQYHLNLVVERSGNPPEEGYPQKQMQLWQWFVERFKSLPELFDELRLSAPVNE